MPTIRDDYRAPRLNRRVILRNPADRPAVETDDYGNEVDDPPPWGNEVWAARRDRRADVQHEDAVQVYEQVSVFTVRRPAFAVAADVQVVDGGDVFHAQGPPLERGRRGNSATHLEIIATLRR